MTLDFTDDEARVLAKRLRQAIEYDPYPFAPRLDSLKAILAKLEPPAPQSEPLPREVETVKGYTGPLSRRPAKIGRPRFVPVHRQRRPRMPQREHLSF